MTANEFDKVFGHVESTRGTFTERLGRADPNKTNGAEPQPESAGSGDYKPYGYLPTGAFNESCEVARWIEGTETAEGIEFQYRFLMQIGYVGEEQLKLYLPDCIVVIDGMYLRELRKKLARRQVTFMQQYSPKVWPEPVPKDECVIENISVMRPEDDQRHGRNH